MSTLLFINPARPRENYRKMITFRAKPQFNGRNYFIYIPKKYHDIWDEVRENGGEVEVIILVK